MLLAFWCENELTAIRFATCRAIFYSPTVILRREQLLAPLKQFFGFSSFRPLQEEIIRDALADKDVFAVLPTGGGKSLCFQLPALVRPGLTVVVSPLIALMKDQVDALQAAGVAATFLNSSLAAGESRPRLRGLHSGEFRLLYVAPERLMMSGFLEDLKKWNVNLFAIDEAHCISEWGHDFRPEYRQLSSLRQMFPGVPMMALTATATERVRGDIVRQLHLKNPACYVASFNRPNLTYRVAAKSGAYEQILSFINKRPKESGIIYVQARKTAESMAAKLSADGVKALPYHAGMTPTDRTKNQEAFLRDEARVICATIAFGMGINKPNVRFVIHYDLPKNIEGYYQETGRAGRDGLPSECLLLFSPGDRVKQMRFIDEKPNPQERDIARAQLEQMIHYAEIATCRREFLLGYFGEKFGAPVSDPARFENVHQRAGSETGAPGCCRLRQLPRAARDLGRDARCAKIFVVRLSHPREKRFRRRHAACRRGALRRGDGKGPQIRPSKSFDLQHRRRTHARRVGRDWPRTGAAWSAVSKRGEVQHRRTDRCRPRGAEIAPENHVDETRRADRAGETSHRRNRLRRGAV